MRFRDRVIEEARKQRELRNQGLPVPFDLKIYARLGGLIIFIISGLAFAAVLGIGLETGSYYIFAILFMATLALLGAAQFVTGRHLLRRDKKNAPPEGRRLP